MYDKLVPELQNDPDNVGYATKTNEQILEAMLADADTIVVSYFAGFRTLAAILTQEEYDTLRTYLNVLAGQSYLVADMVKMLEMPGDERGVGGGIDFGHPAVRQFILSIEGVPVITQETKAKILAIAERPIKRWQKIGLSTPPELGNIESARQLAGI